MAERTCTVIENGEPCREPSYARSLCSFHYERWRRDGDPRRAPPGASHRKPEMRLPGV